MLGIKEKYLKEIVPVLQKELGYNNSMQVPKVQKITLNMGVGKAVGDKKAIEKAQNDLEKIAGQKPIITKVKKSVASYKIREGFPIGCKVTLRKTRMYEFLDRLVMLQYLVLETSVDLMLSHLMAVETTIWELLNK